MKDEPVKKSVYPDVVTRGPLSSGHSRYNSPPQAKGPKMGDAQNKIIIFGIGFFIVFTLIFAFSAGLGRYFTKW